MFWDGGIKKADVLSQGCYEQIKKDNPRWNVVLFNELDPEYTQYYHYLSPLEVAAFKYFSEKISDKQSDIIDDYSNGSSWRAVKTDFLRFLLLRRNGGVWVDISTAMLDSFDSIVEEYKLELGVNGNQALVFTNDFNRLTKNKDYEGKMGPASYGTSSGGPGTKRTKSTSTSGSFGNIENWLILARKNSVFMESWLQRSLWMWLRMMGEIEPVKINLLPHLDSDCGELEKFWDPLTEKKLFLLEHKLLMPDGGRKTWTDELRLENKRDRARHFSNMADFLLTKYHSQEERKTNLWDLGDTFTWNVRSYLATYLVVNWIVSEQKDNWINSNAILSEISEQSQTDKVALLQKKNNSESRWVKSKSSRSGTADIIQRFKLKFNPKVNDNESASAYRSRLLRNDSQGKQDFPNLKLATKSVDSTQADSFVTYFFENIQKKDSYDLFLDPCTDDSDLAKLPKHLFKFWGCTRNDLIEHCTGFKQGHRFAPGSPLVRMLPILTTKKFKFNYIMTKDEKFDQNMRDLKACCGSCWWGLGRMLMTVCLRGHECMNGMMGGQADNLKMLGDEVSTALAKASTSSKLDEPAPLPSHHCQGPETVEIDVSDETEIIDGKGTENTDGGKNNVDSEKSSRH